MTSKECWTKAAARSLANSVAETPADWAGTLDDRIEIFESIIRAFSPFKEGVVYMQLPQCKRCHWWRPDGTGKTGDCVLSDNHPAPKARIESDDFAGLETDADFGCIQWKAKE